MMRKMKYERAVMELVEFDFEDVLNTSDEDNYGDGEVFGENTDDARTTANPWVN